MAMAAAIRTALIVALILTVSVAHADVTGLVDWNVRCGGDGHEMAKIVDV